MMLAVQPTLEFVSIPHNVTYLTGIISGSEIGLHGIIYLFFYLLKHDRLMSHVRATLKNARQSNGNILIHK